MSYKKGSHKKRMAFYEGPFLTPAGTYRYEWFTNDPWPFYRGAVTLPYRDDEQARRHFEQWVKQLKEYLHDRA